MSLESGPQTPRDDDGLQDDPEAEKVIKWTDKLMREARSSIEERMEAGQSLDREDLIHLYEIDDKRPIDPRLSHLRKQRDTLTDELIIFDCSPEQVAHSVTGITSDTKAYIGPLEQGIVDLIKQNGIEYFFTSFPEGRIQLSELTIGGQSNDQLIGRLTKELLSEEDRADGRYINPHVKEMMQNPDFTTLPVPEQIDLVKLKVGSLQDGHPTTDQIFARALEIGLELCPAEVGPHQRLKDMDQGDGRERDYSIAMKPITDRYDHESIFMLSRDYDLRINPHDAYGTKEWNFDNTFVFRLP